MISHFQEVLENKLIRLQPLQPGDFDVLYAAASDPLIWEQHPNPDRWKKDVFRNFFEGALKSEGAYLVKDFRTDKIVGSSRYYDYNPDGRYVFIGYTFLAREYWGKGYNLEMKTLMLQHAFQLVDKVYFHVGIQNKRSQRAMEKLGAEKLRTLEVAYFGEKPKINIEYLIRKEEWETRKMKHPD